MTEGQCHQTECHDTNVMSHKSKIKRHVVSRMQENGVFVWFQKNWDKCRKVGGHKLRCGEMYIAGAHTSSRGQGASTS